MKIQPIVEGEGDVAAVPVLLRRMRDEAGAFELQVMRPIRQHRSALMNRGGVHKVVKLARRLAGDSAILILFDSDDDCPKELGPQVLAWACEAAGTAPCAVVMAHREFEAWFLASIESLRGHPDLRPNAASHSTPERRRGAKEELQRRMVTNSPYVEKLHQPQFAGRFAFGAAFQRCRSFRKLTAAFGQIAISLGCRLGEWPPSAWLKKNQ